LCFHIQPDNTFLEFCDEFIMISFHIKAWASFSAHMHAGTTRILKVERSVSKLE
jgi:hypothetical protein